MQRLEACPLRKADSNSRDFVVNRLFMKLFKTNNIDTVNYCRTEFQFELPCNVLEKRRRKFLAKYRLCENVFCKFVKLYLVVFFSLFFDCIFFSTIIL